MDSAPDLKGKFDGGLGSLEQYRTYNTQFGRPANFSGHINESKCVPSTATLHDPHFFRIIMNLTGNIPREGGLITFPESSWLASIALPHQPLFIGQPANVNVFGGMDCSSINRDAL